MNVVDSSAWLAYFAGTRNADAFATVIERPEERLVPTLTLFEVFKRVLVQRGETDAVRAVSIMRSGSRTVDLDAGLAITAARLSATAPLPLADAIILATAKAYDAVLWTQDADFRDMPGVEYRAP
ncbi:MAG: type II toxin-antitoxin system VapC family toxin [Trueperaceae bacterium]|nr:type II toxin-antitoxin system VapC family toxin [Trueperaceae bacterium]